MGVQPIRELCRSQGSYKPEPMLRHGRPISGQTAAARYTATGLSSHDTIARGALLARQDLTLGTEMGTRGPDPRDREIAKRLRVLRLQRNWSQAELANALSITSQQVQKYERGANRITAGRLARIAEILEVSVMYFYDDNRHSGRTGAHAVAVE